jgi:choline dehydrogenase-like flavoprotein
MICDANTIDNGTTLQADLCIVGAGAAGIALALQFLKSGRTVLLLEAGGETQEQATQSLYEGSVVDPKLHSPPSNYRQRMFGGSTTTWGGRCIPLDPIDFVARPWIAESGWPIAIDALLPYYPQATRLCEAGRFAFTAEEAFAGGMRPMLTQFKGHRFTDNTLERFSCPTDFGRRYRSDLAESRNVSVLLHANVTNIRTDPDGTTVESLEVRTLTGRVFCVRAQQVVLATGGLEVPRLLLASRDHHANGIGNAYDQVGRFYMCHIAGTMGEIKLTGGRESVWHGYQISDDGIYCRRRFALTATAQRELEVGNFVARLHHPRIPDPSHRTGALSALYLAKPFISYEYRKRLHGEGTVSAATWLRHVRNVMLEPIGTASFLLHMLRQRILATRKFPSIIVQSRANTYSLDFHAEQEPNRESRVQLSGEHDALGLQRILVDWRYGEGDIRTVRKAAGILAEELSASGCGEFRFDPEEVAVCALRDGAYGGHHIGTARMSATPQRGVVDADCRVHGMSNLFIASSATFPTSGQANPTLTIVAMALRLGEHLQAPRYSAGIG